jgi:signal transduction histidine kinase
MRAQADEPCFEAPLTFKVQKPAARIARMAARFSRSVLMVTPCLMGFFVPDTKTIKAELEALRRKEAARDVTAISAFMLFSTLTFLVIAVMLPPLLISSFDAEWYVQTLVVAAFAVYVCRTPARWKAFTYFMWAVFITICTSYLAIAVTARREGWPTSLGAACASRWYSRPFVALCASPTWANRLKNGVYPGPAFAIMAAFNFNIALLQVIPHRTHVVLLLLQWGAMATASIIGNRMVLPQMFSMAHWLWLDISTAVLLVWLLEREARFATLENVAKAKLVDQERMLASLLCHEIRTPLTTVSFFLDSLELHGGEEEGAPSQCRDALARLLPSVKSSVTVLVDIVENCRHLAKVESGTYELQREDRVNMRQLVDACLGTHGYEREAGLSLELECAPQLVILSDRLLWRHVLMNLISNAVKFTMHERDGNTAAGPPSVVVRIQRELVLVGGGGGGSIIRVEVSDSGPGMSPEEQASIFSSGGLVSGGRNVGAGLGLHLCLKIIQMMGGELEMTSPCAGARGTRIVCIVPCDFEESEKRAESCSVPISGAEQPPNLGGAAASSSEMGKPPLSTAAGPHWRLLHRRNGGVPRELRVLIVEDDDLNYLVLQTSLIMGFRIAHGTIVHPMRSSTAEAALAIIDSEAGWCFDLIITDQHLEAAGGLMKGAELLQLLSKRCWQPPRRQPLFAVASGNADYASFHACGADIVWSKPYPKHSEMVAEVVQGLEQQQQQGEEGEDDDEKEEEEEEEVCEVDSVEQPPLQASAVPGRQPRSRQEDEEQMEERDEDQEQEQGRNQWPRHFVRLIQKCWNGVCAVFGGDSVSSGQTASFSETLLPTVPEQDFRDAWLRDGQLRPDSFSVRAFLALEMAVFVISNVASQSSTTAYEYVLPWWTRALGRVCVFTAFWDRKNWHKGLLLVKTGFFIFLLHRITVVSLRLCDDVNQEAIHGAVREYDICHVLTHQILDAKPVSIFWAVNGLCCFIGGLSIRLHLRTMATEILLILCTGLLTSDVGSGDLRKLSSLCTSFWICIQMLWVAVALERRWRFHFLESCANQRLIDQQRTLVDLLW